MPVQRDHPQPETYPLPDAVTAVQNGTLRIPQGDGFKATADIQEGCRMCGLFLQHEHGDGVAAFPF
jgi:hypothetical protein